MPRFKIALIIAQEEYDHEMIFPTLGHAPGFDAEVLAQNLRDISFEVICLKNLTLDQTRSAIDLFCSLVDVSTFALIYYNGHAMGGTEDNQQGQDLFLACSDSYLHQDKLLWHGEIVSR